MWECPTSWLPHVGKTLSSLCPCFICEMGIVLREELYYILHCLFYGLLVVAVAMDPFGNLLTYLWTYLWTLSLSRFFRKPISNASNLFGR